MEVMPVATDRPSSVQVTPFQYRRRYEDRAVTLHIVKEVQLVGCGSQNLRRRLGDATRPDATSANQPLHPVESVEAPVSTLR